MKDELQQKLAEMLEKMMNGIDKGSDFINAELPDYINQLLMWFGIYYGLMFLLGVAMIIGAVCLTKMLIKKIPSKPINGEPSNWFYDSWEFSEPSMSVAGVFSCLFCAFALVTATCFAIVAINIQWLQILIAPKVWLVEYISKMV